MTHTDLRGNPVSTDNARAIELFEQALVQFQSYFGDPLETIDAALAEAPDFVMGHVFRATVLCTLAEAQFLGAITASVEAAEALHAKANDRERKLTAAVRQWLDGDWHAATQTWESVLASNPRDALALQAAHLADFYRGDSLNLRDRVARVLPAWNSDVPGYSYVLGMQAFGLEECNQYKLAEQTGLRALEIEPRDAWTVHAVAHVLEMQNRYDEGIRFYTSRQQDWAPDNGFAFHNWWHLGLYHIERKEYAQALHIFDTQISPEPSDIGLTLVDATAFLWRLHLYGADVGARWRGIAEKWAEKGPVEAGYYAFNDVHALMAYVAEGRIAEAEALLDRMAKVAAKEGTANNAMTREVGLPVGQALLAFGKRDYATTVDKLSDVRHIANRFGGSHAQRDLLNQTMLEAAIRGADRGRALSLINERLAHKPQSPLAWRYHAKLHRVSGDTDAATQLESKADSLIYPRDVA